MSILRAMLFLAGALCSVLACAQHFEGWPVRSRVPIPSARMTDAGKGAFSFPIKSLTKTTRLHPKMTVLENGTPLVRTGTSDRVRYARAGRFATSDKSLWFAARDRSDPRVNGRTYALLLPAWHPMLDWAGMILGVVMMLFALGKSGCAACRRRAAQVSRAIAPVLRPVADLVMLKWMRGAEMPLSFAAARMALGLALWLLSPMVMAGRIVTAGDLSAYDPVGPFCFLCPTQPSAALIDACLFILPISALCLAAGLLSRLSLLISVFAVWVLASTPWLFGFICHGYTPFVLAALPLLAADCQTCSVDGLLRRLRNKEPKPATGTRPAVLGMQLMAGLVFLSAAVHKIYLGNGHFLKWAFSDSLRNLILTQQLVLQKELAPYLEWVVTHEWVWQCLALATITCQSLPFLAFFVIKHPWLRLIGGLALATEIVSLRVVMGIFPQPFILFGLVFVDWEYFTRRPTKKPSTGTGAIPQRGYWVAGILALQAVVGFHWYNVRWLYPFTSFPMFSKIYAPQPYDAHLPMTVQKSTWHVDTTPPLDGRLLDHLFRTYHELPWNSAHEPVTAASMIAATVQTWLPNPDALKEVTVNAALYEVEPYPSKKITLKYEAGFFRWLNGKACGFRWKLNSDRMVSIEYAPEGFQPKEVHLGYVPFKTWSLNHLTGDLNATGGSVEVQFKTEYSSPPKSGVIEIPFPAGGWLVFMTRDALGKQETWSGPVIFPPDPSDIGAEE